MTSSPVLADLNPRQQEAALHAGAPLLILAGAGSGKTRVITAKIAHLVASEQARPQQILAVTFTNKAAAEMRDRVKKLVGGDAAAKIMIRTFHSFGSWLLRVHGERLGFEPRQLSIYDDADVRQLLRGQLDENYLAADVKEIAGWIETAKNRALTPDADLSSLRSTPFPMEELYATYQTRLATMNAVDFGDLILLPVTLLRSEPEVRAAVTGRFRVVLVDEFQDANRAQFELLQQLQGEDTYICVVGDDDQSIYGFRGADVDSFLAFPDRFPGTRVIRLEQNYRSTGAILDLASAVVAHNRQRMGKTLWTDQDQGEPPTLTHLADQEAEARFCADLLRTTTYQSTAILYRMNFQSRTFETLFQSMRIPYRIVGTVRFYEREEVKDALAYLALLYNPRDEVAFRRAASKPRRGIGPKTAAQVLARAADTGHDLIAAAEQYALTAKGKAALALRELAQLVRELRDSQETATLAELTRELLQRSGLYDAVLAQDQAEHTTRSRNLEELVSATSTYGAGPEALAGFLEDARLAATGNAEDEQQDAGDGAAPPTADPVTLITVHNTKGLEFDQVILTGLEEGIFPATEPVMPRVAISDAAEEEERRLFYVGVTRARFRLHLTVCRRRVSFGFGREQQPSRFVQEIPPECIEVAGGEDELAGDGDGPGVGQGVSHIDYGIGVVKRRWVNAGEGMLEVLFETGRTATFIARYADLDPVSGDD